MRTLFIEGEGMKRMDDAMKSAEVAKQTIGEWQRDEQGRVHIHPDIISKAVDATIFNLQKLIKGE